MNWMLKDLRGRWKRHLGLDCATGKLKFTLRRFSSVLDLEPKVGCFRNSAYVGIGVGR